jgi:hypothetical protein
MPRLPFAFLVYLLDVVNLSPTATICLNLGGLDPGQCGS